MEAWKLAWAPHWARATSIITDFVKAEARNEDVTVPERLLGQIMKVSLAPVSFAIVDSLLLLVAV